MLFAVVRYHRFRGDGLHPILCVASEKTLKEAWLSEIESAPVVRQIEARAQIMYADRVVSESLEYVESLPHREKRDYDRVVWRDRSHRLPRRLRDKRCGSGTEQSAGQNPGQYHQGNARHP